MMSKKLPDLLTMIAELIAIPSVSSSNPQVDQSNLLVIEKLANWCQDLGCHITILPTSENPNKFNLIARLGQGSHGLLLAGHSDTVPYDAKRWQSDPLQLTELEGRLYGLGTCDMKSFFPLALMAMAHFSPSRLKRPVVLLVTADEETTMSGAKSITKEHLAGIDHALIGEPTNLQPIRMHKGIMTEAIRLQGISGHSSDPSLGNNALEGMYRVIGALLQWRDELQREYHHAAFKVPTPTLNLGYIHGGDSPNRICGECELYIDLRLLPGMDLEQMRMTLRQRVLGSVENSGLLVEFKSLFHGLAAMETPNRADIVSTSEKITGKTASSVAFGTEAPYLQRLGIETVILGPGDIAQAHQPNEFIYQDRLESMLDILIQLIDHFCVSDSSGIC